MPRQPQEINVHVGGGTFTHVDGNVFDRPTIFLGSGIQALNQVISHGAMHDSAERDPPPRCHPGTREKATTDIIRWIEEPIPSSSVLWVNGREGVGKSALMQLIAERGGIYFGGCFFFRRGVPGCNQKESLFSTLAYQLAMNIPGMLEHVEGVMSKDFSLPKKAADIQLQRLIVEPIRLLPLLPNRRIIIIDGLDECEGHESQRDILSLVSRVSSDLSVPIRFIIASRPEHQIYSMFNEEPLFSTTRHLVLDEEYDSDFDIQCYLQDKFGEIHTRNRDIMRQVRHPWPSACDLSILVFRASGQFIYASTVIKFVGSVGGLLSPQEKLNIILNPGPMQASAFSELDRLYTQILSAYGGSEVLVQFLGILLALEALRLSRNPICDIDVPGNLQVIADIAGLEEDKACLAVRALQSVAKIHIEPVYDNLDDMQTSGMFGYRVELSHRSFHDFLRDEARSGPYFINPKLFIGRIFCRIFEIATVSIERFKR
ncbi:hypothetical protein M413DRAFT_378731 [Hebeloma cylindrosporum]|uniref:Nephrocystin 3-like N-terminal domain-containing protein n=1 Tax=Hebeloma cylindrosporum TaxID=76867 RepID=A0A0C3CJM3_HEBCY|nr:hypothetical protein M413DRAFT_378731 [Hebeloma cylindrosporum h7]